MSSSGTMVIGVALGWLAIAALIVALMRGRSTRVPADRLNPAIKAGPTRWKAFTERLVHRIDGSLKRGGRGTGLIRVLEDAGLKMRPGDLLIIVGAATLATVAIGLVVLGPVAAGLAVLIVPVLAKVVLGRLGSRRRAAFADQLDDSLQLLAGNLRAGHSLLQALDSVSREAEKPTSMEFARLVNETRVGRELGDALDDLALRVDSPDFAWVAQAIAIHREVGGDLAEVLGTVSQTIRERNQIRRQVKALSAEGKLSAYVLMALPFGITMFLSMSNPEYIGKFTESYKGYTLIGAAAVLLVIGALWLRKVVSFKF